MTIFFWLMAFSLNYFAFQYREIDNLVGEGESSGTPLQTAVIHNVENDLIDSNISPKTSPNGGSGDDKNDTDEAENNHN
eukprot:CAMPEP_0198262488 /NCGR_PEP_ID=MMETSP1447-20131203/10993_1 /TAXON_ID=420782 /ORGANISM="Chaetoceros dichaeta, Strain CCMP1751" /LENGTH=78 /DNA_ID=CAMNT_0043950747 /DNA_START=12 /DNA_END=245 /DNA_ORIENTATION=+